MKKDQLNRYLRLVAPHLVAAAMTIAACGLAQAQGSTEARPAASSQPAGLYMEQLSDCMACHTRPGGTPFAGGREIGTPFGTVTSPNITPDKDTGIGGWSEETFYRALHDGIGHDGQYLYPVMPYTSYTRMTREDVAAIKAYLDTLKPVFAPRAPNNLSFPFNIRASLLVWRELFFHPGAYQPNPARSAEWNRGAYIVQGPGHCGECHSPRDMLGGIESARSLSGGVVQQWLAPNISSDKLAGIGARSVDDIVTFLRTGADSRLGVAFGPMAEVVHDSLRYATDADIRAVAVYLKDGPDRPATAAAGSSASQADLAQGQHLYLANCAVCHQDNGRGIPGTVANLSGNAALLAEQPHDAIVAVLQGLQGSGGYGQMPSFAGALNDRQISDIINYIRTAWPRKAPANATPAMVANLRGAASVGAAGTEAARAFDCPPVGSSTLPAALATPAQANFLATDDAAFLNQRVMEMVGQIRAQQPGISDANLANTMNAAFCPAVANRTDLSSAQKRATLLRLNDLVQQQIAAARVPSGSTVVATVPLGATTAQALYNAAAAHHQTADAYIAELLKKNDKGQK
ncbi:MAG: c-type cytochrome [Gammaproteobacteria bacterium]